MIDRLMIGLMKDRSLLNCRRFVTLPPSSTGGALNLHGVLDVNKYLELSDNNIPTSRYDIEL
jgi:hypothetical protein